MVHMGIQSIYLTTPQVYLTKDGDINDSHPGYTLGVELDISLPLKLKSILSMPSKLLNLHSFSVPKDFVKMSATCSSEIGRAHV